MYGYKSATIPVKFSGTIAYTLTSSYVASDAIELPFAKRLTIFPYYAAGATETGNTCQITVETNPFSATDDPTGAYWSQIGNYTNSTGTWTEEKASYVIAQGTASVYTAGTPIVVKDVNALQIRITVKENGVASNAGKVKIYLTKSDIS